MNVQGIAQTPFSTVTNVSNLPQNQNKDQTIKQKNNFLDKFNTEIKNSCDMNDTVTVPRTIFKGYLAFMAGTSLGALNGLIKTGEKGQRKGIKAVFGIASTLISLLGTWCFVRPYVIKDSQKKQ